MDERDDFGNDPLFRYVFDGDDELEDDVVDDRRNASGDLLFLIAFGNGGGML